MYKTKRPTDPNTLISIMMAGLPLMFLVGLFTGFQIWGKPNVQADQALNPEETPRYEIPIYEDDPVLGPEDAIVTIVEFSDYECPYCRSYHWDTFVQIRETYGDQVRYVYKDLPLTSIHPNAIPAANAAQCAQEQDAFWEYHDLLFGQQLGFGKEAYLSYAQSLGLELTSFEECLDEGRYLDVIGKDTNILVNLNAPISTPTFFINGQYLSGAQPFSVFAQMIEAELASK